MPASSAPSSISSCRIIWSTQSGRAKACARRSARILGERTMVKLEGGIGSPFDETPVPFLELLTSPQRDDGNNNGNSNNNGTLILMFVSTTGDGEQCDSIRNTWKSLLQKSLPRSMLADTNHEFALFCLGDRAYGPQFCAAGRKLAVRLLQLGMSSFCDVGYGDDNTPNGGVFRDLDDWLEGMLLPKMLQSSSSPPPPLPSLLTDKNNESLVSEPSNSRCPYRVQIIRETLESQINRDIGNENHGMQSLSDQDEKKEESNADKWEVEFLENSYRDYFTERGPVTAYSYDYSRGERIRIGSDAPATSIKLTPLLGNVTMNERITDSDWKQNTRHIEIELTQLQSHSEDVNNHNPGSLQIDTLNGNPRTDEPPMPYIAGDVASILPFNSQVKVNRFLSVLPDSISSLADSVIRIDLYEFFATDNRYTKWPRQCTLRGWLTYCADIQSLPEREDLRTLSEYCVRRSDDLNKDKSLDHSEKLRSFSETSGAALYADYILREKRSWIDLFHDFESLREPGSRLTMEALLMILPPMRTRDFSIASAPSMGKVLNKWKGNDSGSSTHYREDKLTKLFSIELCVAVVEGKTRLGRSYHGICSKFLSQINPAESSTTATSDRQYNLKSSSQLLIWIRQGTFGKMPTSLRSNKPSSFEVPIICVGAGTGIAPMRALILERVALRFLAQKREDEDYTTNDSKTNSEDMPLASATSVDENENILVFGSRKQKADYYYWKEWETLKKENSIRLLTAFSQDQFHKMYVQKVLRTADDGSLIAKHILERGGGVFIAGNPKMARAVKQEIIEALSDILPGGEKQTIKLLNKMQRMGRFSIEAWN